MSEQIKVDGGLKVYDIVNQRGEKVGDFYFNPADTELIKRHSEVMAHFEEMKKEYRNREESVEMFIEMQDRAVEELCYLAGNDSAKVFFKVMGAFSLQGGQFYYEKVLDIIAGLIRKEAVEEAKKMKNKLAHYKKKYGC